MSKAVPMGSIAAHRVTLVAVASAIVLGLLSAVLVPMSASATGATLTGKVVGPTGTALSGVTVQVVNVTTTAIVATTSTAASGAFTFSSITPDTYTLKFGASATTFAQYFGGTSDLASALPVTLTSDATSTLTAALAAAGSFKGTVKSSGGTVITGATVTAYALVDRVWTSVRSVSTTSSGYVIGSLEPGEYRIKVSKSGYRPVYSGNAGTLQTAISSGVVGSKITTANFVIGTSATVSGVVTASSMVPVPLAGVKVQALRYLGDPGFYIGMEKVGSPVTTSATGTYTIGSLPPGDYTLYFDASAVPPYGSDYLGAAGDTATAQKFTLGSGAHVTGKNATLLGAGSISGHVSDGTFGLPNVRVTVSGYTDYPDDGIPVATTFTDASGNYSITTLGPGTYNVVFGSFTDDPSDIVIENTLYRRKLQPVSIAPGGAGVVDQVTSLRGSIVPTLGPTMTTSSFKVNVLVFGNGPTWNVTSNSPSNSEIYSWYRNGVKIPGATSFSYLPTPGDVGKSLSFGVQKLDWEIGTKFAKSFGSAAVVQGDAPAPISGHEPSINGDSTPTVAGVGTALKVDTGRWQVADGDPNLDMGIVWTITWQRSPNGSSGWTDIASGPNYTLTAADRTSGPWVRAHMVGQRFGYAEAVSDDLKLFVEEGAFTNVVSPKITKTSTSYVVSNPGTWSPAPTSYTYEWLIYDETGNLVVPSPTATSIPISSVVGDYVLLHITPVGNLINSSGINVPVKSGQIHTATVATATTGTPLVGQVLTAPNYVWVPSPGTTTYTWQYLSGTTWKTIPLVNASTYQVSASYKGMKLRVITTAQSAGYGSATKTSSATATIGTGLAPTNTGAAPSFSGSVAINNSVTVDPGGWTLLPTSYAYQWRSRTGSDTLLPRTTIAGATSATYAIPTSLENAYLDVLITVKRTGHANATTVLEVGQVLNGTLKNLVKPVVTISQDPVDGTHLAVTSTGTWTPAATTFNYQWIAQLPDGSTSLLGGDTFFNSDNSALYFPVDVHVTASRPGYADGTVTVPAKNGTFGITVGADVAYPDGARVDKQFAAVDPSHNNSPISLVHSYQWQYKSGASWLSIAGATGNTFSPSVTYLNKLIRVRVTTTAPRFTTLVSDSPEVLVEAALAPTQGTGSNAPLFSGAPAVGAPVSFSPGRWDEVGLAFTYQWQVSDTEVGGYANIPGATTTTYKPTEADYTRWLHVVMTATKAGHAPATEASPARQVGAGQITSTVAPVVTKSGNTLTVTTGSWGTPGLTGVHYEWRRYNTDAGAYVVVGADQPTYTLQAFDPGRYLGVVVTVSKPSAWNDGSRLVTAQLGGTVMPTYPLIVSGTLRPGQTLSIDTATFEQVGSAVTYQWLRNGSAISHATTNALVLSSADIGKTITVKVTATRVGFTPFVAIVTGGLVKSATVPVNVTAPTISVPGGGDPTVEMTLTASHGTWSLSSMSYAYQWHRNGHAIAGATASTYTTSVYDEGADLTVVVTASKSGYQSVSAQSESHTVLTAAAVTASADPVISAVGTVLSVNSLTFSLPASVQYQWLSSTDGTTFSAIDGATSSSLDYSGLGPSVLKVNIRIKVSRPGHNSLFLFPVTPYVLP